MRLDAQKRDCDALVVFHAGKALETALQVIYAKVNNRIPAREYPGVSRAQMEEDRRTHSLATLYDRILQSMAANPELRNELKEEFESVYQTALHTGIHDLIVDGEVVHCFFLVEDAPFREASIGGMRHGAALTLDNSSFKQLLVPPQGDSDFAQLPWDNFPDFLAKADAAYYGRRNMRWAHYAARDHERGRPYVTVGTRFFARFVQALVTMGGEQRFWHERYARRWHGRRRAIIGDVVRTHIQQSFAGSCELPEMTSVQAMMDSARRMKSQRTDDYGSTHIKWRFDRATQKGDADEP